MTALAGIVTFDDAPTDRQTEEQIARALSGARKSRANIRSVRGAIFAQRAGGGGQGEAALVAAGNTLFAATARLDNRAELGAALDIAPPELARTPDHVLLERMYRRRGEAGLARCVGSFAFALWDAETRRLTLARDCLGNRALFFHRGDRFVAFATTLGALFAMACVPREIDEILLADFLAVNLTPTPRTFYRGVERVPSRTLVTIDNGGIARRQYWSPDIHAPPPYRRDEDYIERARELFDQAVASATSDTSRVAITTSGGFDSSAVAATVARLGRSDRIDCYTMVEPADTQLVLPAHRYLERGDKVEALARMYPALNLNFIAPDKPHPNEEDVTRLFARTHLPILGPFLLRPQGHMHDAIAAAGHRVSLVGTAGNFGLTWTGQFSLLALLQGGRWETFAHDLSALARQDRRGLARTFAGEVVVPAAPASLRRLIDRLRGRAPDDVARYSALNPAFIAEHDLTHRWREQGFDPWFGANGWNAARHRAYYLFDHNQFGRDLRGTSEEWLGWEVRDPHADRRLLEFLLAVPESMYRRDGVARSFARAVLADRLPAEILGERRIGANTVTWFRQLDARRQDISSELEQMAASPLARRLIDLPRLRRLMNEWPADAQAAEKRRLEFRAALGRGLHVGRFIRWVERGNA